MPLSCARGSFDEEAAVTLSGLLDDFVASDFFFLFTWPAFFAFSTDSALTVEAAFAKPALAKILFAIALESSGWKKRHRKFYVVAEHCCEFEICEFPSSTRFAFFFALVRFLLSPHI